MNAKSGRWCVGLFVIVIVSTGDATPVPILNLAKLVEQADVVAMGTVLAISDVGSTSVGGANGAIQARSMLGELQVDHVLKGPAEIGSLQFRFAQPDVFIGYGGVGVDSYRMFFLKRNGGRYEFVSPYYPSVVALSGNVVTSGRALDKVVEAVASVVESESASVDLRREAIHVLWGIAGPVPGAAFRSALRNADPVVHLTAAAALLAVNDVTAVPIAEEALLRPYVDSQSELLHNLRVAISQGLRDPVAAPALGRLLSADVETRRAASSALRRMRSESALKFLVSALDDPDMRVGHNAVMGFAETTGQTEWGPSIPAFQADQERYRQHWRDWNRGRQAAVFRHTGR
jgi:hypothetical protein